MGLQQEPSPGYQLVSTPGHLKKSPPLLVDVSKFGRAISEMRIPASDSRHFCHVCICLQVPDVHIMMSVKTLSI